MRLNQVEAEIAKYENSLPIMRQLNLHLKKKSALSKAEIGWHCHLTEMTAAVAAVLLDCGARLIISECDPLTTSAAAVEYMQELGAEIFLGADSPNKVLDENPHILCDTGFVLISHYLQLKNKRRQILGASEITTSGITKLRAQKTAVDFPVININDGRLKKHIENFHGVADGLIDALFQLTGKIWSGRKVAVVGYGPVGAGVAAYLRRLSALTYVCEINPVRKLIAHYDGFALSRDLADALSSCELIITATGSEHLISSQHLPALKDGALLINVGHLPTEINVAALKKIASKSLSQGQHLEELTFADGKKLFIATQGSPANVAMLSGSCEPTLIHLTTEALCMKYLIDLAENAAERVPGEMAVPPQIEEMASTLALRALGLH